MNKNKEKEKKRNVYLERLRNKNRRVRKNLR